MYAALWRVLPGPTWVKVVIAIGLLSVTVFLLMAFVFPFIAATFLVEGSTLDVP
jgi:multisubunit Na+/H+ antiporter MnhF subunit